MRGNAIPGKNFKGAHFWTVSNVHASLYCTSVPKFVLKAPLFCACFWSLSSLLKIVPFFLGACLRLDLESFEQEGSAFMVFH